MQEHKMHYVVSEPIITAKSDDHYFVFAVEDVDRCYMQHTDWRSMNDWNKSHADPWRARRSRFYGTIVRRDIGFGRFALIPYEFERKQIAHRIGNLLRSRMHDACKSYEPASLPVTPTSMAKDFLGCSLSALVEKFEDRLQHGMTWDNFGARGWVIDHVMPVSRFDFRKISHVKKACHHSNLRPCWETENIRKGAKVLHAVL